MLPPPPPAGQQPQQNGPYQNGPYQNGPYSYGPSAGGPHTTGPYYAPIEHPNGTTVLILGILALVVCGVVLGPIAWIMGNKAIKEIDAAPGYYTNRSNVSAGRICGMIATILWIVGIVAYVVFIAAIFAGASRTSIG